MLVSALAAITLSAPLLPLHTKGESLVDSHGNIVILRGVNFGGWLVEEIWMTPWANKVPGSDKETVRDSETLWSTISGRLGKAAALRVKEAWRDNWITADDFRRVKALGLNHVRIPFLHTILDEPRGLDRLRSAVKMAKSAGLYVVLDMHGAPGGQSNEHHTGRENRNRLWFEPNNILLMEKRWKVLARAFKDEPAVAAYDVMNEPMGAPNPAMLSIVYDRVIRAIRTVDARKVVIVDDGYKGFETTIHPNVAGWTNAAFSLHFYNFEAKSPADHVSALQAKAPKLKELQGYRRSPIYVGEFQLEPFYSPSAMRDFTRLMESQGWSWACWTYKACGAGGPVGEWGLYRPKGAFEACNPFKDSESELIRKIRSYRTTQWVAPEPNLAALRG